MTARTLSLWAMVPAIVALALPSIARAAPDCVDNVGLPILSGGTNGVRSIAAADIDGDGDTDVVAVSANDDTVRWFESDGGIPPTFVEHVVATSARGAVDVQAADVDLDDDTDIVVAAATDDQIIWYENEGGEPPHFIERRFMTAATATFNIQAVYVADVEGDGDLDLLSASFDDSKIAIQLSNMKDPPEDPKNPPPPPESPTFTNLVVSTSAVGASDVFAADLFDAPLPDPLPDPPPASDDGHLEILSASRNDDTIAWYERTLDANDNVVYTEHSIDTNADGASSVFAADLDGDTHVDVLSASSNDGRISWYRSDGNTTAPSFTKKVISAQATGASAVSAADLDGDGDLDVLSASRLAGKIVWYENLGGGTFGDPAANERVIDADAPGASAVLGLDFGKDGGGADVLAASSVAGTFATKDKVALHLNGGGVPPAFSELVVTTGAVAPETLLTVDVDADTHPDLVVANAIEGTLLWLENNAGNPPSVVNGTLDPPSFTRHLVTEDAPGASDLFWADLDGDSLPDLLAALAGDDSIAWYRNLGGGNFGDPATNRRDISSLATDGASAVQAADLDGDGDLDVISTSANDDRLAWYVNNGGGDFGNPTTNQVPIATADGAADVVAVDRVSTDPADSENPDVPDGRLDLLVASSGDSKVVLHKNVPPAEGATLPTFTPEIVTSSATGARAVQAADIDEDGKLDVLVGASIADTILWFGKEGTTWVQHSVSPTDLPVNFVRSVAAVDLDGDGDLDVVSASSGDDTVQWFQSNLEGLRDPDVHEFKARSIARPAESTKSFAVADFDGDGKLDVVTAFLFEVDWHAGNAVEVCFGFDATDDNEIDGSELGLLGAFFAQECAALPDPAAKIDYTGDCFLDGEDLAIMRAFSVWGHWTNPDPLQDPPQPENKPLCAFTCP